MGAITRLFEWTGLRRRGGVGTFAWHVHHDTLVELLTEPIERRIEYIRVHKPDGEVAVRLGLLRPVRGRMPQEVEGVARAFEKIVQPFFRNSPTEKFLPASVGKALSEVHEAIRRYTAEIEVLHAKECPNCPWDGRTIFP